MNFVMGSNSQTEYGSLRTDIFNSTQGNIVKGEGSPD